MFKIRILNLFAGIGGNRTLWNGGGAHEIIAVEHNQRIAMLYLKRFPNDKVIVADAYEYLEKHYKEFDFIWASPPCTTHSQLNMFPNSAPRLPDLRLYALIVFLKKWYEGEWIVENVPPYYKPLIKPSAKVDRHYIWCSKDIKNRSYERKPYIEFKDKYKEIAEEFGIDYNLIPSNLKRKVLRNCVRPEAGKYILDSIIYQNTTLEEWLAIK